MVVLSSASGHVLLLLHPLGLLVAIPVGLQLPPGEDLLSLLLQIKPVILVLREKRKTLKRILKPDLLICCMLGSCVQNGYNQMESVSLCVVIFYFFLLVLSNSRANR